MVETSKGSLNHFERLRLLTNSDYHTRLDSERGDVNNLTINGDMLVTNELTGSSAGRSNTKAEHNVVESTLKVLQENLTGDTVGLCSLLKHITELALKHTVCILGLLLLCQHDSILRLLAATVIAMLSRGEVPTGQNFVRAEDGFSKSAGNF